ncbi:MAG: aspartate aminotransferase family protein [Rhodospirillaceae bacterium]|jgi:4-aminobutyrate--pyruvate transaminase
MSSKLVNSAASRDIAYHLHPYTHLKQHEEDGSLIIARGEGVRVFDIDGNAYIEGMAGLWCTALGFSEERLIEAAQRQMKTLPFYHSFNSKASDVIGALAQEIIDLAPVPMSKVFFANSGSEAIDTAIKLVWYYNNALDRPEKKKIIAREKAYHGVTVASASLTGLPNNHRDFDLPIAGVLHTDCPHHYRYAQDGESEEEFSTRLANNLEGLIEKEGPETIAAFFAEPVMGAGGVIIPPKSYFEKIQPILKKHDILFVVDEVICGFGRTGNWWGSQTYNLKPDMITMAKALTSGYVPMSALMVNEKIYDAMKQESEKIGLFAHGFTYGSHPLAAAVGLEALTIYKERNIIDHVRFVAPTLQDGLRKFADHPLVGEVRGVGLVGAVEIVANKETKAPFEPSHGVLPHLIAGAQKNGLIVRMIADTVAFSPPLVITEAEIGEILAAFGKTLDETVDWLAG